MAHKQTSPRTSKKIQQAINAPEHGPDCNKNPNLSPAAVWPFDGLFWSTRLGRLLDAPWTAKTPNAPEVRGRGGRCKGHSRTPPPMGRSAGRSAGPGAAVHVEIHHAICRGHGEKLRVGGCVGVECPAAAAVGWKRSRWWEMCWVEEGKGMKREKDGRRIRRRYEEDKENKRGRHPLLIISHSVVGTGAARKDTRSILIQQEVSEHRRKSSESQTFI